MITFDKFFVLISQRGISTYTLRKEYGFSPTLISHIREGRVSAKTIDQLCNILDCQPGDIMEYKKESQA